MSRLRFNIVSDAFDGGERQAVRVCSTTEISVLPVEKNQTLVASSDFSGNVTIVTLGCAKNLVDSEVMLGAFLQRGFRPIDDPAAADLIVVNTCAFLQSAVEEGIDRILEMSRYKKSGRCRKLIVAGCMVERYREDLQKSLPEVDRFVSTDELLQVADDASTTEATFNEARRPYFIYDESMPRVLSTQGHSAYVKISEGCDRPCSFCIIPKIRGKLRSRSIPSVIQEVTNLVSRGVKEINFVAQDLTSYGSDFISSVSGIKLGPPPLVELLSEVTKFASQSGTGFWLRLLYAYPIGVTEELIKLIVDSPVVCSYLDLPLQHISNPVLKRMNRPLGERGTRSLIEQIATIAPELALRSTFIVGFPGESEEDVQSLEQFVLQGYFTHVGVFTYSQEPESKAYSLSGQIEERVKAERRDRIMQAQQSVLAKRYSAFVGKRVRVLVDGAHEETDLLLSARASWQAPETDGVVIINELPESCLNETGDDFAREDLFGKFIDVEVTEVAGYDLIAKMLESDVEDYCRFANTEAHEIL